MIGELVAGERDRHPPSYRQTEARHRSCDRTLERLPQHIGEEANQDVGLHALLLLMPDGTDRQVALVDPKGRLRLGQLDVGSPERLGRPIADVGAQHVAALGVARPIVPFGASRPLESQLRAGIRIVDETDRVARRSA